MDVALVILLILLINSYLVKLFVSNYPARSESYLWLLFSVHFLLTIAYLLYSASSRSDSVNYYNKTYYAENAMVFFYTGTKFIGFLAYPFVQILGLSYYAVMLVFSYFGYLAIVAFYLAAVENIQLPATWNNLSPLELVFLLPNVHFWTSSLGKGSAITFGIGLFAFGLSRINRRILITILGAFLIYMIRPHILLAIVIASMLGLLLTNGGLKGYVKWSLIVIATVLFVYVSGDVLKFTDTESLDITSSSSLSHRTMELTKASSGIDINNYNFFFKMFTFWFRPLFFDGLGALGILASFENLICLIMAFAIIRGAVRRWSGWNGLFRIQLFIFLLGSFILSQVTGNLGIALRQKAQLMPFFFILYCKAISLPFATKRNVTQ
ncbi:MAG: hypothetical protein RIR96_780 [Bacteroidota bacterium]